MAYMAFGAPTSRMTDMIERSGMGLSIFFRKGVASEAFREER